MSRFGCYVGNIDASVPIETIRQVFSQCGAIMDASLNGRDTDPYRFGFIDFANEADRERALKFNGVVLAGRPLKVGVSKGNVSSRPPEMHSGGGMGGGNAESTALLVQLVQSGAVNPANLTPEQQRVLGAAMLGLPAGMPIQSMMAPPPQPMGIPPMGNPQPYNPVGGPYQAQQPPRPYQPGRRPGPPSANPSPSEELLMLRQAQRKTFFDVVRKDADKYQEKLQKRKNRREGSGSDSSSSSDDEEERRRDDSKGRRRERSSDRNGDGRNAL